MRGIRSWLGSRTEGGAIPDTGSNSGQQGSRTSRQLPPATTELDVSEVDPLEEARILLTYGREREATKLLAWHVQANSADDVAFTQLARLFLSLDEHASFVTLIDTGVRQQREDRFLRQCLAAGFKRWPDDLNLTALAERVGLALPAKRRTAPSQPIGEPPKARPGPLPREASRPPVTPQSVEVRQPASAPFSREPAGAVPLVEYLIDIDSLTTTESYALRVLDSTARLQRLRLGRCATELMTRFVQNAISREPRNFSHYVDLLLLYAENKDVDAFARTLWRMFWVLGDQEPRLRSDLLQVGEHMGGNPLIAALHEVHNGRRGLREIGDEFNLLPYVEDPALATSLVIEQQSKQAHNVTQPASDQRRILDEVRRCIASGSPSKAMDILEITLLSDPSRHVFYPILFSLYEIKRAFDRFRDFEIKILGATQQPPLETVLKILDMSKKLQKLSGQPKVSVA
jgi:hypothetical protein